MSQASPQASQPEPSHKTGVSGTLAPEDLTPLQELLAQDLASISASNSITAHLAPTAQPTNSTRINMLFVAPYQGMSEVVSAVAPEYPAINATCVTGDLEGGLRVALAAFSHNYDVVASRGGTLQILEEEVALPMVEIELSVTDVIRQLQALLAKNPSHTPHVAAIGFANALRRLATSADVLPVPVRMHTVDFSDQVPLALEAARAEGCTLFLCDNYAYTLARDAGVDAHLLQSGADSIRDAFEQATRLMAQQSFSRRREELLWGLVKTQQNRLIAFDDAGAIIYSALDDSESEVADFCRRHLQDSSNRRLALKRGGRTYSIKPLQLRLPGAAIHAFGIRSAGTIRSDRLVGLSWQNPQEVQAAYEASSFSTVGARPALAQTIAQHANSSRPVLIRGERSCGKRQIARVLYLESAPAGPLITVDCPELGDHAIDYLLNSHNSPLFETGVVLFFQEVGALAEPVARELLDTLLTSGVTLRNRLIISATDKNDRLNPSAEAFDLRLHCALITTLPLRQTPEVIPDAALRWLDRLAAEAHTGAPKLTAGGLDFLCSQRWPRNYLQFRRVLDWAFASCEGAAIDEVLLASALAHVETQKFSQLDDFDRDVLDLRRPLADIERDIATQVVARCGGNKTQAASELGISRTTLWRLLK